MSEPAERDHHRYRTLLRWWDGCASSITIPAVLFVGYGYVSGVLGGRTALILLAFVVVLAVAQTFVYSDLAARCPQSVGGISGYAHEGWKSRLSLVGPVATYGYWFACSSSLAIYGLQIGNLIQAQWFADATWTLSTGTATIGLPHLIALGVLLAGWAFTVTGRRPASRIVYGIGILALIPIIVSLAPQFTLSGRGQPSGPDAIVWMFVLVWVVNGVETASTVVPQFRDVVRHRKVSLRLAAVAVIALYFAVPLGVGGLVAHDSSSTVDPVGSSIAAFDTLLGGAGWLMTSCLITGLVLLIVMTAASSGNVLHGSAGDGLTITQLGQTNRFGVPARVMTLDLVVNAILILFVGEAMVIIIAGILGYLLCHAFALSGYLNLRRNPSGQASPVTFGRWRIWIAVLMVVVNVAFVAASAAMGSTGLGGEREVLVAVLVLSMSIALYLVRRVVQDNTPFRWRENKSQLEDTVKENA